MLKFMMNESEDNGTARVRAQHSGRHHVTVFVDSEHFADRVVVPPLAHSIKAVSIFRISFVEK
jgi:hypothetical protein